MPVTPSAPPAVQLGFEDFEVSFVYVPNGAPRPEEWFAAHPDHVSLPATFTPDPEAEG